ncbi:MAG TPA: hypothetical protein VF926_03840 [Mycobacterium sp.]
MSELPTATADPLHLVDDIDPTPQVEVVLQSAPSLTEAEVPPHSTLITEQEVIFSTAAVVPAQPIRWWTEATRVVAVAMRHVFVTSSADLQPRRRYCPPRASYLEYSRMEREMHRL